jgi:neutral ceramidase
MRTFLAWFFASAIAAFTPASHGAAAEWKAGLASVKITPQVPVMLSGYANRIKPFERVAQDIFAKALVLEDSRGHRAVILTSDLIGMPAALTESLAKDIETKTGLTRAQVLFTWSHNHAGPSLSLKKSPGPGVAPADAENRVTYTRWLQDQLVDVVVRALANLEPARLSHGRGVAKFVMNRREFTEKGIILGVNPQGPADRSVPVLRIDAADGSPRAVLFGAAAHNTTLSSRNFDLCGDYAGFAQHFVQEKFPGVQAMFMMGCGGDANPYPRGELDQAKAHGDELGAEVVRVLRMKLRPVTGPLNVTFDNASLPLQPMTREQLEPLPTTAPNWQLGNAAQMLAMLKRGEKLPAHYRAPLAVWQFGRDLTLVAISGEVVYDYLPLVEKALGPLNLWVAGYANDDFGYLPSARIVHEGGYETRGLNSGDGWFAAEAQDAVVAKLTELARKAGRPIGGTTAK